VRRDQNRVEFIFEDEIERLDAFHDGRSLTLKSGREVRYELLVGSDGGRSRVKELKGIPSHGWSHKQKAIVLSRQPGLHGPDGAPDLLPVAAVHRGAPAGAALDARELQLARLVGPEQQVRRADGHE
jgi:2-polyprenyl-6-methoxyphenol hydroxylase-like FAD-dependent oxidoreductase